MSPAATVRKFKQRFPALKENPVQRFGSRTDADLRAAKSKDISQKNSIPRYRIQKERPLLLSDLDSMVQRYILGVSNRGAVITRAGPVSVAKALLKTLATLILTCHDGLKVYLLEWVLH